LRVPAIILFLFFSYSAISQDIIIRGRIVDADTKLPVSYSSVYLKKNLSGQTADSSGVFIIRLSRLLPDTLIFSHVGYKTGKMPVRGEGVIELSDLELQKGSDGGNVVVNTRVNKGLFLWRKIMARKPLYNPDRFFNYAYEEYNKLNVEVKNINIDKMRDQLIFKPFSFIINPIAGMRDSAGNLPGYLMETINDYAFQRSPRKTYEFISSNNSFGMLPANTFQLLTLLKQRVNAYDNFIRILDRDFIGPFYDHADNYYSFSVPDTQIIDGVKFFRFAFRPKRSGVNAFEGYAWVRLGTYELRDISMNLNPNAVINYLRDVRFYLQYISLGDSLPFMRTMRVSANLELIGKKPFTLSGTQTTTLTHAVVNSDSVTRLFDKQDLPDVTGYAKGYNHRPAGEWERLRPDSLNPQEKRSFSVVDSFVKTGQYVKVQKNFKFLGSGYWETGNWDIGKWYNFFSTNRREGQRFRIDLSSNIYFNRNIFIHGYVAYGVKDNRFKGLAESYWVLKREPSFTRLHVLYKNDIDNNVKQYGEIGDDNIFSVAIRKPGGTRKFLSVKDLRFEAYHRRKSGLSFEFMAAQQEYIPLENLPPAEIFATGKGRPLNNFCLGMKIRFAYLEKYLIGDYFKYSLETKYPVITLMGEAGIQDVFQSAYSYHKLGGSISHDFSIAPLGRIHADVFGGKIYGTLPFTLLENHPGNDMYYYNNRLFNMMYRFEYLSDQYTGFHFQHSLGGSVFRLLPFMRKLKWNQFWTANGLWGSLSESNQQLNKSDLYFKTLTGRSYFEFGTGMENILKYFRIDCIWRYLPQPLPTERAVDFGVFGSVQFKL
jgi:hypothetical protein